MATNYKTTWKSTVLQEFINRWFKGRITSAIEEYKAKVTDPKVKNKCVTSVTFLDFIVEYNNINYYGRNIREFV